MTLKIILLDDLHLEGREAIEITHMAHKLNEIIQQIKNNDQTPLLICAGDIAEGIEGVRWISQFQTTTLYVCGNHEFWGQDYYETYENIEHFIEQEELSFIHLLNNDVIEIEGVRFIGATLWTSIGDFLPWYPKNNMVKFYPAMGDFKRTTAKRWYTANNTQRLIHYLQHCGVEKDKIQSLIDDKLFNPLLEREENHRSTEYLLSILSEIYTGKTIVITHHLPAYEVWSKVKGLNSQDMSARQINQEKYFLDGVKSNTGKAKELLMMGYYANNLKDFMYGKLAPDFWFHGHLHVPVQEIIGRTQIISSPMGYKKQNSELQYKIIDLKENKQILKNYLLNEVSHFDWQEGGLKTLKKLEELIPKIEQFITMRFLSWQDTVSMIDALCIKHQQDISNLSYRVNEWLKLFVFFEHPEIQDPQIDIYMTEQLLNLEKHQLIMPQPLCFEVSEQTFEEFGSKHLNYYKQWMTDLQKMQIQLIKLKKSLIQFIEAY